MTGFNLKVQNNNQVSRSLGKELRKDGNGRTVGVSVGKMDRASHQATTKKGEFILRERRNAIPGPHFKCLGETHKCVNY